MAVTPTPIHEIHVGDSGLLFSATVKDGTAVVDMSRANVIELHFQKPDGSMLVVEAMIPGGGTDGVVSYVTRDGDFDQDGTWSVQVYFTVGPSQTFSNINKFKVFPNLPLGA